MYEMELIDFKGNNIRVALIDGEPWFLAADVCKVLGLTDRVQLHLGRMPERHKHKLNTANLISGIQGRGNPVKWFVSEPGLYSLILRSDKPEAREFEAKVTEEILPSIRKNGWYVDPTSPALNLDVLASHIVDLKNTIVENEKRRDQQIVQQVGEAISAIKEELHPRTLAALAAEERHGGQTLGALSAAIVNEFNLRTENDAFPFVVRCGAIRSERRYEGDTAKYYVEPGWKDVLEDTMSKAKAPKPTGTVRIRPGMQKAFMERLAKVAHENGLYGFDPRKSA